MSYPARATSQELGYRPRSLDEGLAEMFGSSAADAGASRSDEAS